MALVPRSNDSNRKRELDKVKEKQTGKTHEHIQRKRQERGLN